MLNKKEDIRLWLSGEDEPIHPSESKIINRWIWVDRAKEGYNRCFLIGPYTSTDYNEFYDPINKEYLFTNDSKYAYNTWDTSEYSDFGNHWRLEFEGDFAVVQNGITGRGMLIDFGSVRQVPAALKGFGIKLLPSNNIGSTSVGINWKMYGGNQGLSGISNLSHPFTTTLPVGDYVKIKGYYEIIDGKDGYDRLKVCLNDIIEIYDIQIPKTLYTVTGVPFWIARGDSTGFKLNCKLKELKMVVID